MAQVFEFMVEAGEVFSGLTAGDGQPNFTVYVFSGGTIIDTVIFNSGWDLLSSGAVAIGTTVLSGGTEYVYGAVSSDAQVSGGGEQQVAGGVTVGTEIVGGAELVGYSAQAIDTTIATGVQGVVGGGVATGTVIGSGGVEETATGG